MVRAERNYLDERTAEALAIPRFHANQLVCILAYVDAHEKLILNLEELCGGLERLVQSGRIREVAHLAFSIGPDPSRLFSGVSAAELETADSEYRQYFREQEGLLHEKR
ncbi:MAG: hypothetical protein M5U13_11880 [Thermoanaerobaculia bacterium]|nr:hypothetical protein [Thermoanaerobaculia bacterium]